VRRRGGSEEVNPSSWISSHRLKTPRGHAARVQGRGDYWGKPHNARDSRWEEAAGERSEGEQKAATNRGKETVSDKIGTQPRGVVLGGSQRREKNA